MQSPITLKLTGAVSRTLHHQWLVILTNGKKDFKAKFCSSLNKTVRAIENNLNNAVLTLTRYHKQEHKGDAVFIIFDFDTVSLGNGPANTVPSFTKPIVQEVKKIEPVKRLRTPSSSDSDESD